MVVRKEYTDVAVIKNVDLAISVMRDASKWLQRSDKNVSRWWQLKKS